MPSIFVTGFPGFLGSKLVERLLNAYPSDIRIACLVQPSYRSTAQQRMYQIEQRIQTSGRVSLLTGDITQSQFGLSTDDYTKLAAETTEIFHLAAIYDLGVKRGTALLVNVEGTRRVLSFAVHAADHLRRFHYVSTCYVSGSYPGLFYETDLIKGQSFKNHYEETKYLAEVEVQWQRDLGLPTTIYRPSIVVGDSTTGETQKYDGIYYIFQWLLRQPSVALLPIIGDPRCYEVNFVPCDFVVEAMAYLSTLESSLGKVYHLCDPMPNLVDEVIEMVHDAMGRKILRIPVPGSLARQSMKVIPGMKKLARIEPEALSYFTHPTHYHCENTLRDLADTMISCPRLSSYIKQLIDYMKQHPEIRAHAMA